MYALDCKYFPSPLPPASPLWFYKKRNYPPPPKALSYYQHDSIITHIIFAGLLEPQREKSHSSASASASSVFSRLDHQNPGSTTTTTSTTTPNVRLPGGVSKPSARVTLDTSKPRTVSDVTSPSSSSSHLSSSLRITAKPVSQSRTATKSASVGRLSGRLGGKKEDSLKISSSSSPSLTVQIGGGTLVSDQLASTARSRERLGTREKEMPSSTSFGSGGGGTAVGTKLSGRLGARAKDPVTVSVRPASLRSSLSKKPQQQKQQQQEVPVSSQHSMVADEYEYQTLRQLDVRSRLERKERETRARRGGPLAGRLAKHHVFGRLE